MSSSFPQSLGLVRETCAKMRMRLLFPPGLWEELQVQSTPALLTRKDSVVKTKGGSKSVASIDPCSNPERCEMLS